MSYEREVRAKAAVLMSEGSSGNEEKRDIAKALREAHECIETQTKHFFNQSMMQVAMPTPRQKSDKRTRTRGSLSTWTTSTKARL